MARKLAVVLVAALATLMTTAAAKGSHPKTLTVGQQSASCPNPGYERIGDAIEDAAPGDTIAICPGTYAEGPGTPGTSVLTIHKDLTLAGPEPTRSRSSRGRSAKRGSPPTTRTCATA